MPPISWTSKWRWPSVRLAASRTVAKAGTRMSSRRLALGELLFEFVGARAQRLVGELLQLLFQRIDGVDAGLIGADAPVVGGTEQLAGDSADHRIILPTRAAPRSCLLVHYSILARDRRHGSKPAENAALFGLLQGDMRTA